MEKYPLFQNCLLWKIFNQTRSFEVMMDFHERNGSKPDNINVVNMTSTKKLKLT